VLTEKTATLIEGYSRKPCQASHRQEFRQNRLRLAGDLSRRTHSQQMPSPNTERALQYRSLELLLVEWHPENFARGEPATAGTAEQGVGQEKARFFWIARESIRRLKFL
jgi:hypothetical protein